MPGEGRPPLIENPFGKGRLGRDNENIGDSANREFVYKVAVSGHHTECRYNTNKFHHFQSLVFCRLCDPSGNLAPPQDSVHSVNHEEMSMSMPHVIIQYRSPTLGIPTRKQTVLAVFQETYR